AMLGQQVGYHELDFRHPLLPVMIAPFALFGEYYVLLAKMFMLLVNSAFVLIAYFFGKRFSRNIGLLSAFLTAVWPYHIMSSSWVMTDGLAAILLTLTIMFYFEGFLQEKKSMLYLGGFFLGLAILGKITNLMLPIILAPLILLNLRHFLAVLKSFCIAFLVLLPYLIAEYLYYGNPLHGMIKAFGIGNAIMSSLGPQPFKLIILVFYDFFGIVLSSFMIAGVILFAKDEVLLKKAKGTKKLGFFWLYCFAVFVPYYVYVIHEGATPIWWDTQRFLLSFLPFGLLFATYFIDTVLGMLHARIRKVLLFFLIILLLTSWSAQYMRFAQPAISLEDGLRYATKELGLYLKEDPADRFLCLGNCPPLAFYSGKKTRIVYTLEDFKLSSDETGVVFLKSGADLALDYPVKRSFCRGEWCGYLLENVIRYDNNHKNK
ncbi:glycosyltransferase family 39 protein, partial [Candidatus Woesearchaeota archaeon]|nr:glycosyltransferase family 39 protein [Candidatus Woesearchaeota archaeon]